MNTPRTTTMMMRLVPRFLTHAGTRGFALCSSSPWTSTPDPCLSFLASCCSRMLFKTITSLAPAVKMRCCISCPHCLSMCGVVLKSGTSLTFWVGSLYTLLHATCRDSLAHLSNSSKSFSAHSFLSFSYWLLTELTCVHPPYQKPGRSAIMVCVRVVSHISYSEWGLFLKVPLIARPMSDALKPTCNGWCRSPIRLIRYFRQSASVK
mmetsp:Transcript_20133/g.48879  ORF Transcript_20133/g.48879 Transcript_20133/m.48879 type:complete len:207 (-) Transcript_20133:579-1199(-)